MARAATEDRPAEPEEVEKPTKRIVLRRERAIVLTDEVGDDTIKEVQKLLRAVDKAESNGVLTEAWTVVGEFEGKTKTQAIEAHAGKPDTPDAKPGAYKAPGAAAWAGGAIYEAPPQPLVQRKALD